MLRKQRPSYRKMLAKVCAEVPAWEPGTRFRYCSDSFYLLAEAIVRLTGMSFPTALRRRLLEPLGMDGTTFDVRPERARAIAVQGIPMGNIVVRELILRFLAGAALPGGGLFGTAEDLLRFGRAMLPRRGQDGPRVLSQARIDEMLREQTAGIPELRDDGTTGDPHYALGWRKRSLRSAGMDGAAFDPALVIPASPGTVTHGGASGTRLWVDPERDLVFVFLTNVWYRRRRAGPRGAAPRLRRLGRRGGVGPAGNQAGRPGQAAGPGPGRSVRQVEAGREARRGSGLGQLRSMGTLTMLPHSVQEPS